MDWTLYLPEKRPNPLVEVLEFMRIGNEHIVQLLLAGIMGIISMGVSHIQDLTKQVHKIGVVLNETKVESMLRFSQQDVTLRDHEQRIRVMEYKRNSKER